MIAPAQRLSTVQEYYFSRKLAEIRQRQAEGKPVLNLGIGNPDLPPPPAVVQTLQQVLTQPDLHGYQPYQGLTELREAIADWYQRVYGVSLPREGGILPMMGSKEGIYHLSMAFVNPGDAVLIPDPGYPTYAAVSRLVGAEVHTYGFRPEAQWQIDFEALEALPLDRVKILWLNTPHMPTGQVQSPESLARLVALARKHQFLIVNDNPYSLILDAQPKSIFQSPGATEVAVELNSLSKSHHMPGWRVGWLAGAPEVIQEVLRVKSNQDSGMFKGIQLAAIAALQTPMEWHVQQNEIYARRQKLAIQLLEVTGCNIIENQQGMFVWAKLPEGITDAEAFADRLLYDHDVFAPPGTIFGPGGAGYLRVSLCVPESTYTEAQSRISTARL